MVSFTHLYGISEIESRTNRYDQSISLIPSEFIDANNQWSWFFESEEETHFLGLGRQKISNEPPKLEEQLAVATVTIKMDRRYREFHRVVLSLSEALDKTGGLLLCVDIFFASVVAFFASRVF